MTEFVEPKGIMPWEVPPELGWPEGNEIGGKTHKEVGNVLQNVPIKKPSTRPKTFEGTLAEFLASLKSVNTPSANNKAKIIDTELLFLSKHFTVDTSRVKLQKLPGNEVGKHEGAWVYFDPVLFNNKAFTEDDFMKTRQLVAAHELTHKKFNLDHEGLTNRHATLLTGIDALDYEDETYNTAVITDILGEGDKEKGVLRAIELYTTDQYNELFEEFAAAYEKKHPDKVKANDDVALKIFQLAFPRLKLAGEGKFAVDEEMIDDAMMDDALEETA